MTTSNPSFRTRSGISVALLLRYDILSSKEKLTLRGFETLVGFSIAKKFNTYRFADYKNQAIGLIKQVCTVSAETVKIVTKMSEEKE